MPTLGLETEIVDADVYRRTVEHLREAGVRLPTFAQLSDPAMIPAQIEERLGRVDPDEPDPVNLYRVHWHNHRDERGCRFTPVPDYLLVPPSLSGVEAPIALLLGDAFPMIRAHKVLAAYACLAPRLVTGQFDPTRHKAIWPSTGNYCRGGVAISRTLGCRGVAVLPEGMSRERFDWLERWVSDPSDIVRTPGTESNVKEIYDRCAELERDPENIVFNQFSEFGNHLVHVAATANAAERVFEDLERKTPGLRLRAFVSATGSAGTLGAGDALKERHGALVVAAEALECPTLLYNGWGEHNIQGIGDKHVPLIHNVMNTDVVTAVSDRATDALAVLFASDAGLGYLASRRGVPAETLAALERLGLSSICNLIASVKLAKHLELGPHDLVVSVATDGAAMYRSEHRRILARDAAHGFGEVEAAAAYGRWLLGAGTDHLRELTHTERRRIFDLGYFTWVEQQGIGVDQFAARREQRFWRDLRPLLAAWDERIEELDRRAHGDR